MFPGSLGQLDVNGASLPTTEASIDGGEPCVNDDTGASIEVIGLSRGMCDVEGVEEGGGGDLSGVLSGQDVARAVGVARQTIRHLDRPAQDGRCLSLSILRDLVHLLAGPTQSWR